MAAFAGEQGPIFNAYFYGLVMNRNLVAVHARTAGGERSTVIFRRQDQQILYDGYIDSGEWPQLLNGEEVILAASQANGGLRVYVRNENAGYSARRSSRTMPMIMVILT